MAPLLSIFGSGSLAKQSKAALGAFVFAATISANATNYNVKSAAIAAGWDQATPLQASITINSGVIVYATSGNYAFDTGSTFPAGSTISLTNNGTILGFGGAGGAGGGGAGGAGASGGTALIARYAISITNNGRIAGGGGGGGAGDAASGCFYCTGWNLNGANGGVGIGYNSSYLTSFGSGYTNSTFIPHCVGNPCTGPNCVGQTVSSGASGNGGTYGSSGGAGQWTAPGGAGGACTSGSATYITWAVTGTRNGTIG